MTDASAQDVRRVLPVWLLPLLLLFAAGSAFAEDGVAVRALTVSGQVSVERGRDLWAVQSNDLIRPGEVIVCGPSSYALFRLEDGSQFEVFADSRVVFRPNQGNWRDLLDIFLGRVKIQIQKLGGRPNPYRVNSATALIAVRGTVFDVRVESDATTTIAVEEGLVGVSHKLLPGGREILVKPGESLVVRPGEPLTPSTVSKARIATRILGMAIDQALQTIRLGGGRGRPSTTGGSSGGAGQAPPPKDAPNGDSGGSGGSTPPASGGNPAPPPPTP